MLSVYVEELFMKRIIVIMILSFLLSGLSGCRKEDENILKLQYLPEVEFLEDFGEESIEFEEMTLEYGDLTEMEEQKYTGQSQLDIFVSCVKDRLNIELNDKWLATVHFYDEAETVGMVKFQYTIGKIRTDKSVVFNLKENRADRIYWTHLNDRNINEEMLLKRVENFEKTYTQEKKVLKEGEILVKEDTVYSYHYSANKLVYSYNVFFSYGENRVINNDYGTICMIDENGNIEK